MTELLKDFLAITNTILGLLLCFGILAPHQAIADRDSEVVVKNVAGASQCLVCHNLLQGKSSTHDFSLTSLDSRSDSNLTMNGSEHGCEACHGPSGDHAKRLAGGAPMPPTVTFRADKPANRGNSRCLACHEDHLSPHWMGSPHDNAGATCVDCHMIHTQVDPVLTLDSQPGICGMCHADLIAAQDKQSVHDFDGGDLNCSSCHNPHAGADNVNCSNCHQQDEATIARQPPKARDFHRTGLTNKLSCVRCHGGIAHGLPGWVEEIKKSQQQYND